MQIFIHCKVVLQWINICILLHLLDFYSHWISMHGTTSLKFIDAKRQKIHTTIRTSKGNYRINAAIWYNKTCRQRQLTPAYVNIRINGKRQQCQKTLRTANQYRINQEIKFLYTKKIKLNKQLFKLHLKCADSWQRIWPIIMQFIGYKLTK